MNKTDRWPGSAVCSIMFAVVSAWLVYTTANGPSRILNQTQVRPTFLLASAFCLLGIAMGFAGFRRSSLAARLVAAVGLLANLAGLVVTGITYAKWWVA